MSEGERALVIGTAGHVDHGKTALVRALTGVETDRWDEERERGLTIDIGFARLPETTAEVGVVDVPGHEDFVKNMLAGATGLDLLLLVVAADEGPMPQTREHLTIADLLGVREGVVALTKADRVDAEWLELARDAVREELRTVLGHAEWPIVTVSAIEETGLKELRDEIERRAAGVEPRPAADLFRLPVDRSFTLAGVGTVVTGTVWSGRIERGETVRFLPGGAESRVRGLQVHGEDREAVAAGRRCALAVAGVDPEEVPRGETAVREGEAPWRAVDRIGARVRLPPHVPRGIEEGGRVRVYHGTREVMARVELRDGRGGVARPGETRDCLLGLEKPLVARIGDRFVLRFYSPVVTIGGGRVAEVGEPRGGRVRSEEWDRILEGSAAEALGAAAGARGVGGLDDALLPLVTGRSRAEAERLRASNPEGLLRIGGRWFEAERLTDVEHTLLDALERLHDESRRLPAVSLEGLRAEAGEAAEVLVEEAVRRLAGEGRVVVEGPRIRLPEHAPRLTPEEEAARDALLGALREGGLEPPELGELGLRLGLSESVLHDLVRLLEREGRVVRVSRQIYLDREVAEETRRIARRLLSRNSPAGAAEFKQVYGVTRKYLIPLLEWLDRTGTTRRTDGGRELAQGG